MRHHTILLALFLSACGSSGYDEAPAPPPTPVDPPVAGTQVPTSATTSSLGATSFVRTTSNAGDDAAEPLEVGTAVLASSETDEPAD
jgi:hypothetical protein